MTAPIDASELVQAPTPELPAYGLQAAATVLTGDTREVYVGVHFKSDNCSTATGWAMGCAAAFTVTFTKTATELEYAVVLDPAGSYQVSLNGGAFAALGATLLLPASPDPSVVLVREVGGLGRSVTVNLDPDAAEDTEVAATSSTQPPNPDKSAADTDPDHRATPFTVVDSAPCGGLGMLEQAAGRARTRLAGSEWRRVEQALWTGDLGNVPFLASADAVPASGTAALPLKQGLSALESALGRYYNGTGVIHLPRWVAPYLADRMQMVTDGAVARTPLRTKYAFHSHNVNPGPPGEDPAPDGSFYAYATGAVVVRRGDAQVPATAPDGGGFDFRRNRSLVIAERSYVITLDCPPVWWVLITLAGEDPAPAA